MEVESLESERERWNLWSWRERWILWRRGVVTLVFKSLYQKFHHMMKSFFSKVLFSDHNVVLEIYKVLNNFRKVLKEFS